MRGNDHTLVVMDEVNDMSQSFLKAVMPIAARLHSKLLFMGSPTADPNSILSKLVNYRSASAKSLCYDNTVTFVCKDCARNPRYMKSFCSHSKFVRPGHNDNKAATNLLALMCTVSGRGSALAELVGHTGDERLKLVAELDLFSFCRSLEITQLCFGSIFVHEKRKLTKFAQLKFNRNKGAMVMQLLFANSNDTNAPLFNVDGWKLYFQKGTFEYMLLNTDVDDLWKSKYTSSLTISNNLSGYSQWDCFLYFYNEVLAYFDKSRILEYIRSASFYCTNLLKSETLLNARIHMLDFIDKWECDNILGTQPFSPFCGSNSESESESEFESESESESESDNQTNDHCNDNLINLKKRRFNQNDQIVANKRTKKTDAKSNTLKTTGEDSDVIYPCNTYGYFEINPTTDDVDEMDIVGELPNGFSSDFRRNLISPNTKIEINAQTSSSSDVVFKIPMQESHMANTIIVCIDPNRGGASYLAIVSTLVCFYKVFRSTADNEEYLKKKMVNIIGMESVKCSASDEKQILMCVLKHIQALDAVYNKNKDPGFKFLVCCENMTGFVHQRIAEIIQSDPTLSNCCTIFYELNTNGETVKSYSGIHTGEVKSRCYSYHIASALEDKSMKFSDKCVSLWGHANSFIEVPSAFSHLSSNNMSKFYLECKENTKVLMQEFEDQTNDLVVEINNSDKVRRFAINIVGKNKKQNDLWVCTGMSLFVTDIVINQNHYSSFYKYPILW